MSATLVLQSHRQPLPFAWLQACLDSVAEWAASNAFDYRFIGDELFEDLTPAIRDKTRRQTVIATDLARLKQLQRALQEDYDCVIWCDADFLIFDRGRLNLPASEFAVGREIWVQADDQGRLRSRTQVHNAFLMFRRGNSFLDFYADTAERLLNLNQGSMPPQFIGPKLLTALHNVANCPILETAGMLSPLVLQDLQVGHGDALSLFRRKSPAPIAGANLSSSVTAGGLGEAQMTGLISILLRDGIHAFRKTD